MLSRGTKLSESAPFMRRRFLRQLASWCGLMWFCGTDAATRLGRATAPVAETPVFADGFEAALAREIGRAEVEATESIAFTIPAVAEDGAVVPVSVESHLAGTDRLVLLAEKNPYPLLAAFDFAASALPFVTVRVKLNATGRVVALARANGRYYRTEKAVRVVVGGCG